MIGAIIGAGLSLAGSVIAGAKSASEKKKYNEALLKAQQDAEAEKNYWKYMSPDQSVKYTKAMTDAREAFKDYISQQEGKDAIMGTQDSSKAKAQALKALGETASTAASNAEDTILSQTNQAQSRIDSINAEQRQAYLNQSAQAAASGATIGNIGSSFVNADANSKLATGRGLFENYLYNKK